MGIDIRDGMQLECISCALCIDACDSVMDKIGRPRGLIVLVSVIMLISLVSRTSLDLNLMPDRNPLFVTLSNGDIRNGYTLKVINKTNVAHRYRLSVEGLPDATITVLGASDTPEVDAPRDSILSSRIFIAAPAVALPGPLTDIDLILTDEAG